MTDIIDTVVFLGPSLEWREAMERLQARYLPPVRRGDLPRAIADGARAIGMIDGEFGQSLAVSVMEIRAALQGGVKIWGGASMGALRAVECQAVGMRGVGWIFKKFADGSLRADDEVALLFDARDYRPLTIPLVNVRWAIQNAIEAGVLPPAAEEELVRVVRKVGFKSRTYDRLLSAGADSQVGTEMEVLVAYMKRSPLRTDRKRLDALMVLDAMKTELA
jgi:hypothetical protein